MTIPSEGPVCKMCHEVGKEMSKNGRCVECDRIFYAEYRAKNRKRLCEATRRWREKNKDHLSEYLKQRRQDKLAAMTDEERKAFRRMEADKKTAKDRKLKEEVFSAYGGFVCACCGETEVSFLSIDHMDNNGSQHRRECGIRCSSGALYRWIRKNKFPPGFQVLCMNCQFGKKLNNGICPHRATCNDHPGGE